MSSFYGTGWSFPPAFDNTLGQVDMTSDVTDIQRSLQILLSTRPGERIMQPTFGCNLEELLFEPLTTTLKTYMKQIIETAILYHEPRIKLNNVDLSESQDLEGLVLIKIDYIVRSNNSRFNFVYPYYKNEKTG
jgi:phage baseplate assembly protein W